MSRSLQETHFLSPAPRTGSVTLTGKESVLETLLFLIRLMVPPPYGDEEHGDVREHFRTSARLIRRHLTRHDETASTEHLNTRFLMRWGKALFSLGRALGTTLYADPVTGFNGLSVEFCWRPPQPGLSGRTIRLRVRQERQELIAEIFWDLGSSNAPCKPMGRLVGWWQRGEALKAIDA